MKDKKKILYKYIDKYFGSKWTQQSDTSIQYPARVYILHQKATISVPIFIEIYMYFFLYILCTVLSSPCGFFLALLHLETISSRLLTHNYRNINTLNIIWFRLVLNLPAGIDSKRDENEKKGEYFLVYCNVLEYEKRHANAYKDDTRCYLEACWNCSLDMNVFTFINELNGINTFKSNLFLMEQSTNVEYTYLSMKCKSDLLIWYFILIPLIWFSKICCSCKIVFHKLHCISSKLLEETNCGICNSYITLYMYFLLSL